MTKTHSRSGFTLIELSISAMIMALLLTAVLSILSIEQQRKKQTLMKTQIDDIRNSLVSFRKRTNRLPCPADGTLVATDADNGVEGATPGTCVGGSPAANFGPVATNTVGGVVPFKTLGMPETLDPWGRRFSYHVDKRLTGTKAFIAYAMDEFSGSIIVENAASDAKSSVAGVLVLSHGPNGHGAFLPSGVRYNAGSTNPEELVNCHCDDSGVATAYGTTFILKPVDASGTGVLQRFDDEGFYLERKDLASGAEHW